MSYTAEERLFASMRNIIGSVDTEKLASLAAEAEAEATETVEDAEESEAGESTQETNQITKVSQMSLRDIMDNEHFMRGVTDRISARSGEIEQAFYNLLF